MAKKYSYKDDFEMLMVRHDYLNRIEDPDPTWFAKFEPTVKLTSYRFFNKFKTIFTRVGYELDDVRSITNCYMMSYMSLYSIERNRDVRDRIVASYQRRFGRPPTEGEIDKKEKINMISFLRQRLNHAVIVCKRKSRNIVVDADVNVAYAYTKDSLPVSNETIMREGRDHGYRKLSVNELKNLKKEAKANKVKDLIDKDGFQVIELSKSSEWIDKESYSHLFVDYKTDIYHVSAEESLSIKEEEFNISSMTEKFLDMPKKEKRKCLNSFIKKYSKNKFYRKELTTARKMLKNL